MDFTYSDVLHARSLRNVDKRGRASRVRTGQSRRGAVCVLAVSRVCERETPQYIDVTVRPVAGTTKEFPYLLCS